MAKVRPDKHNVMPCRLRLIIERSDVEHSWRLIERTVLLDCAEDSAEAVAALEQFAEAMRTSGHRRDG